MLDGEIRLKSEIGRAEEKAEGGTAGRGYIPLG